MSDRLTLVNIMIEPLTSERFNQTNHTESFEQPHAYNPGSFIRGYLRAERTDVINQIRRLLKTDKSAPTDAELQAMLNERLTEKYLQ